MVNPEQIKKVINAGLVQIKKDQLSNGAFLSLSSPNPESFGKIIKYRTTFIVSTILCAIENIEEPQAEDISKKAVKFLLQQKNPQWTFNYWDRKSVQRKTMPLPDDLDDTFCALAAINKFDPTLINGRALAQIIGLLTLLEKKRGGPYITWVVPKTAKNIWRDIDLAVNANIAYFLKTQKTFLPNLADFFEKNIAQKKFYSQYYHGPYPIIYFLSRVYDRPKKNQIIDYLRRKQQHNGCWGNPLNTALATSALLNLGADFKLAEKGVKNILRSSKKWRPYGFCHDPSINRQKYFAGSSALTAALSIEALNNFRLAAEKSETKQANAFFKKVLQKAQNDIAGLPIELKKFAQLGLKKITDRPSIKQIIMLPFWFNNCLKEKRSDSQTIEKIALANLYGWISYTIYDDFMDNQGQPELLPAANYFQKNLINIYQQIALKDPEVSKIFDQTINQMEQANSWELRHTRLQKIRNRLDFKTYKFNYPVKILAQKSFGHALGPLVILILNDFDPQSTQFKKIKKYFENYLVARQINDDAHDWQADLKRGQINFAGSKLIRSWLNKNKTGMLRLQKDLPKLNALFWHENIAISARDMLKHIRLARQAVDNIEIFSNKKLFEKMLMPIESSAVQALQQQKKTKEFLSSY